MYLVQIVDLGPDLIESNELDHNLFGLLDGVEVGLSIILNLMHLLNHLLAFCILVVLVIAFFEFLFDLLQVIVDILGVMQLFCSEIPFEQSSFQPIPELDLLVFYHRALIGRTAEVLEVIHSAIMLSPVDLVPLNTDP